MNIRCVWEHNGSDTIIFSDNFVGAFTRGVSREQALSKMQDEVISYLHWTGDPIPEAFTAEIVQEKQSDLNIREADSDVIFDSEREPLTEKEYTRLKSLCLRSAQDFLLLYGSVPDKNKSAFPKRTAFYGDVPRTAQEMYDHTKNVNSYYFGEIGTEADNGGDILQCRERGFALLEDKRDFLGNKVYLGSYNEEWSLRKLLRRFIWHDRIHAKAMYRMAVKTFGSCTDIFHFGSDCLSGGKNGT